MLFAVARYLFLTLPLSEQQRQHIVHCLFRMTGDRFQSLPSYQHYLRLSQWQRAPLPDDVALHRDGILKSARVADHGDSAVAGIPRVAAKATKTMLMVSHDLGGGTQQHVDDMISRLEIEGWRILLLQRHNNDHIRVIWRSGGCPQTMYYRWPDDASALTQDFQRWGICLFHLHHVIDLPEAFAAYVVAAAKKANVPFDVTIHDYFSICPRFTLFDNAVRGYCGEPTDARKCTACVKHHGSAIGNDVDVPAWRAKSMELLTSARRVYVPDDDVADRLHRYFPDVTFSVVPHPENFTFQSVANPRRKSGPLKVVTIGGIGPHKGSHVVAECARDALQRSLPIEYHIVGYTDIDRALRRLRNVFITGAFPLSELSTKLANGGFHMAFLPAVWPETYSYVLSECWRHGLFTVGFDLGAIGARLRAAPALGRILPYEWYLRPQMVNDALLTMTPPVLEAGQVYAALREYKSVTHEYYQLEESTNPLTVLES